MTTKKYRNRCLPIILLLLAIATWPAAAQNFKVKAALNAVTTTGFYRIPITPELSAYARADLSDIRITGGDKTFVPYINQKETVKTITERFKQCPVVSDDEEGKYTVLVMTNVFPEGLHNISIVLGNTTVERLVSVSGSDDKKKWYIIGDSLKFHRSLSNGQGSYTQTLVLPLSKYNYFKLKIDNGGSDPLKINKVGTLAVDDTLAAPGIMYNPVPAFTQKDSNKTSYILVNNKAPYLASHIYLHVTAPPFFNRVVTTYVMHSTKDSAGLAQPVAGFTVSPANTSFAITEQKAQTILLAISNDDNPPLKISGITTSQEVQYLICWMEKGVNYALLAGNDTVSKPVYDLSAFKKDIPANTPKLNYGPLVYMPETVPAATGITSTKNYWLWPAIIISVIALSFLTYRLMKDMKQSKP